MIYADATDANDPEGMRVKFHVLIFFDDKRDAGWTFQGCWIAAGEFKDAGALF